MRSIVCAARDSLLCLVPTSVLGGGLQALAALAGVVGAVRRLHCDARPQGADRKSTRLNSSH